MIPSKKNNTSPCTPVSSNCVIWQGPDISCIDLCNGDTISDVIAKLATEICSIIDATCECNPDLTGLDISCITETTPEGLVPTLQAIIDYSCASSGGGGTKDLNVNLAKCLQFEDRNTGNRVTTLPIDQFAELIGNQLCSLISVVNSLDQNIQNLDNRIQVLEACVLPCTPNGEADFNVISNCLFKGETVSISTLILAIESRFCQQVGAVGDVSSVNGAISAQGISATDRRLSQEGTIGNIAGWLDSPKSLAESNVNQWKMIDELYLSVLDIQSTLPKNCDNANFVFTYNTQDSNGNGLVDLINLNFQATQIPAGFTDCNGTTTITVTDSDGNSITQNINVSGLVNANSGVNVNIESLNRFSSINLSIPFCVTDGNSQCADRQQVIIPLSAPCPSGVTVAAGINTINVSFPNTLGSDVAYEITATSQESGGVLGTTQIVNPSTSVNYTFTGAVAGSTYDVQITVIAGRNSRTTCPSESVLIPGINCGDVEVITPSTNPVESSDVFLGLYDSGVTVKRYWYDAADGLIKEENVGATVPCDSPTLSSPTMDYLGTPGDVAVTVSYGTEPSPISAETSWSIDGITYNGLATGADGVRVISTGQTSGSVYIKVETTCTGPVLSIPTILRYDFATEVWVTIQSPQECASTSLTESCPSGIEVARQYLECGPTTYTVFGGSAASYWFYIGKTNSPGGTRYIYAGWDNATNSVRSVVECCTCPTFILSDPIQVLCGNNGDSVDITLPYVLGEGDPAMTILVNPVLGSVVQGAISNQFTYTSINPSGNADYADTFQVQLQPSVPGTGNCSLSVMTVQIEMINENVKLDYTDQDIYVFVNTNGISSANGGLLKAGFGILNGYWNSEFGYTGNIYFIPTDSKRWAGYPKAIVDDGVSWLQSADLAWQALEDLPTSWTPGGVGVYKNSAIVLTFSNDSSVDYHDLTLASGYGSGPTAQPTVSYKEDYDALIDMLSGTQESIWAQGLGLTSNQFPDGLSTVLYPLVVNGSGSADAANILQMIAAYTAELIPPSKYGIATAPDVAPYILQGLATTMPYTGSTTPGNTITQLFRKPSFGSLALLDQEDSPSEWNDIKDGIGKFRTLLTRAIKSDDNTYPATTLPVTNVFEVQDCAGAWGPWFVRITDHGCGTIGVGTVVKLNNPGVTFPASGGRPEWVAGTNKCLTIIANCSATPDELTVDLDSTYDECVSCTP